MLNTKILNVGTVQRLSAAVAGMQTAWGCFSVKDIRRESFLVICCLWELTVR